MKFLRQDAEFSASLLMREKNGDIIQERKKCGMTQKISEARKMEIARKQYLNQLISKKDNGRVKIITGIRRCGKSYLLFNLFDRYLRENGVQDDQIIGLALDEIQNAKYRNPIELDRYIRNRITDKSKRYYVMIDEIQFVAAIQCCPAN